MIKLLGPALLPLLFAAPAGAQDLQETSARAPERVYVGAMTTRWGKAVTPQNAWRSYPRPQMRRDAWMNLNGQWDYAIRPKAETQPASMDGKILVPFAMEAKLGGAMRSVTPTDRIWYQRSFEVPANWRGQDVLLHFGAVDYEAHVFVNDSLVGSHRGGSDSFDFNITDYLKPGGNKLVVQVLDPTSTGAQARGKQQLNPRGIWYTPVSGIWQTVWLEPVPKVRIQDMKITPDIDAGTLGVEVALNRSVSPEDAVRITASSKGRKVASVIARGNRPATLAIPNARLWSPDDPFLYDLKVELVKVRNPYQQQPGTRGRNNARWQELNSAKESARYAAATVVGSPSDVVDSYFAMRKSSLGPGLVAGQPQLLLNNKPVFQNGTLDQGWWPDGLLTPPSEEAIRWELDYLKRSGFNMLRKHIKVEPAQYYYEADRMGILIWQDMPSAQEGEQGDHQIRDHSEFEATMPQDVTNEFESELTRMIGDLRNYPSIVTWVVNNEGWGQYASTRLATIVRALDSSRVIDKVSGWKDTGDEASDIFDIHTYEDVPRVPTPQAKRAIVLGEFGGIGLPVEGHLWRPDMRNWGYQAAKNASDYEARYRRKYDEVIRQAKTVGLSAVVYTQTTDVEGEINGLLTYDREVSKLPAETFKRIHAPLFDKK